MKRVFLFIVTMLAAANLYAQVYVGGGLGVHIYSDLWGDNLEKIPSVQISGRVNQVSVMPEIGYAFNDWLSVGTTVSFQWRRPDANRFTVRPYIRGTLPLGEHFGLYLDAEYSYYRYQIDKYFQGMTVGLAPGIKIPITARCGLTSRLAFIGLHYGPVSHLKYFEAHTNILDGASVSFYYFL